MPTNGTPKPKSFTFRTFKTPARQQDRVKTSNIQVYIRIRPSCCGEEALVKPFDTSSSPKSKSSFFACFATPSKRKQASILQEMSPNRSLSPRHGSAAVVADGKAFHVDHVFDQAATQTEVYAHVADQMRGNLLRGYHSTLLGYGQTSSGKTYTILDGLLPRLVRDAMRLDQMTTGQITVQLSLYEIYKDQVRDLLSSKDVTVRDQGHSVVLDGLTTVQLESEEHASRLIAQGSALRTVGSTKMNDKSSRSHMLCTLTIGIDKEGSPGRIESKLRLVDLAGSERIKQTGVEGDQIQESININKDLFVLGKVVAALADNAKPRHVPFRDSKLTRILRESLGGNCFTALFACVSPDNLEESTHTLRYAERMRCITNHMQRNVIQKPLSPNTSACLLNENKKLNAKILQLERRLVAQDLATCGDCRRLEQSLKESRARVIELEALVQTLQEAPGTVPQTEHVATAPSQTSPDASPPPVSSPDTISPSNYNQIRCHAEKMLKMAEFSLSAKRTKKRPDYSQASSIAGDSFGLDSALGSSFETSALQHFEPRNLEAEIVISNMEKVGEDTGVCTCDSAAIGGDPERNELYLPKLGVVCTCGKRPTDPVENEDPLALISILREWQCDFLQSCGLMTAGDLIQAHQQRSAQLAKLMKRWRKKHGMSVVKPTACSTALYIWSKTCKSVVKSVQEQEERGVEKPQRPGFLDISVYSESCSVSTFGR